MNHGFTLCHTPGSPGLFSQCPVRQGHPTIREMQSVSFSDIVLQTRRAPHVTFSESAFMDLNPKRFKVIGAIV